MNNELLKNLASAAGIRLFNGCAQSNNAWQNGFDRVLESDLDQFANIIVEHTRNQCAKACLAQVELHQDPLEVAHRLTAQDCANVVKHIQV